MHGGPTNKKHKFLQMHMHWGADDTKGSEHSIDGKFQSAEVDNSLLIKKK